MYLTSLRCRITPGAKRGNTLVYHGQQQDYHLQIFVSDAPVEGKANIAVIKFLAKMLDLPASQIIIKKGNHSRDKMIIVSSHTMNEHQIHQILQQYQ